MTADIYGWCGKILKVDLTHSKISTLDTIEYADRFLGGRGVGAAIYWKEVGPDVGAFDPENCLILMCGPLTATGVQGAARFEVVGKSPMTVPERFCYGNLGGFFGPHLKRAGYDGIVITGRSEKPCYIWIYNGEAEIRDGSFLWGKGVAMVRDLLRERHGKRTHYVTTGPAGENRCRSATIMTDLEGSATGGFGAVMGAKKLKAVAVMGTAHPEVARPDELKELNRYTIKISQRGTLRIPVPKKDIRYVKTASCYQCGMDCFRGLYRTASGKDVVRKCQSLMMYMPYVGAREGESFDTVVDATDICNDMSLCTMEVGNILEWLHACSQAGYLTEKETGLDLSAMGTREFFEDLVTMIAYRRGFGDILAEGLLRAGKRLGEKAQSLFSDSVSGVGLGTAYTPREYITTALLWAMEPRQPIGQLHEISYPIARWLLHLINPQLSPTSSEVFKASAAKFWGSEAAWNLTTIEGKALAASIIQERVMVKDSLLLCEAAWPIMDSFETPDNVGDPALESRLFSAVTGVETDEKGLLLYGERIFNLQRAILLREGWKPLENDFPPEYNFTHPLQESVLNPRMIVPGEGGETLSFKGNVLDREEYEKMRQEFYEIRGWDARTGLQKMDTFERLGMSDIGRELKEMDLAG
ncbi:MAG: aldehyde ferredoxin oxidoreductase N-terminal domain-containing protein [Desulfatiglans sp.]|jgi:aldehyde:ferredoxin oxidoreductase|nr:aldehyde ferredoxin oxidoreductase N-terminal domain-containing protein [Desulfatiglans sp.]